MSEYFNTVKGEEWFRELYDPSRSLVRAEVVKQAKARRLNVYRDLYAAGLFKSSLLTTDNIADVQVRISGMR